MRILAVNYEYTTTGATLTLLRLLEHLRKAGHRIFVTAAVSAEGPVKNHYRRRGFDIIETPATTGFDMVICNTLLTAPQLLQFAGSVRTVWWIHEGSVGLSYLLANPGQIAAFTRADAVVFPIEHLRDAVYRSFIYDQDPGRFVVIPYGIPPIEPRVSPPSDTIVRIVSVGAVYPRKRHEDLVRAIAGIRPQRVRCVIVGQFFDLPRDCTKLIAANPDRFEVTGELGHDAVLEQLALCDMFCLPSGSEVLPLTTLEAGLLGKPIILSDLPVYEGIWRHGRNCLLHPVGSVALLGNAIAMLASNPELRMKLGNAARQTASRYTEAAFNARFDALLDTL